MFSRMFSPSERGLLPATAWKNSCPGIFNAHSTTGPWISPMPHITARQKLRYPRNKVPEVSPTGLCTLMTPSLLNFQTPTNPLQAGVSANTKQDL